MAEYLGKSLEIDCKLLLISNNELLFLMLDSSDQRQKDIGEVDLFFQSFQLTFPMAQSIEMRMHSTRQEILIRSLSARLLFSLLEIIDPILHEGQAFVFQDFIGASVHDGISFLFHFLYVIIDFNHVLSYQSIVLRIAFAFDSKQT